MDNKQPNVGAGVIIIEGNKTLLSQRHGSHGEGTFGSLGGHVEFGETPIESVKREAEEELGIEIHKIKFLSCLNMIKYDKHYLDLTFTAEIKSGIPKIMEPDKIKKVDWYDLDKLPTPLFEPVAMAFRALNKSIMKLLKVNYFQLNSLANSSGFVIT